MLYNRSRAIALLVLGVSNYYAIKNKLNMNATKPRIINPELQCTTKKCWTCVKNQC